MAVRSLFTINQFAKRHSFLSPAAIRFQIFNREKNNLHRSGAMVRLGKKILIDEEKYFDWIDAQQEGL